MAQGNKSTLLLLPESVWHYIKADDWYRNAPTDHDNQ